MPEYVYALFDFVPENPDEITFKTGDRIEVVERDDTYGDGWWQVSPLRSAEPSTSMCGLRSRLEFTFSGRKCTGKRCVHTRRNIMCSLYPPSIKMHIRTHHFVVVSLHRHLFLSACVFAVYGMLTMLKFSCKGSTGGR